MSHGDIRGPLVPANLTIPIPAALPGCRIFSSEGTAFTRGVGLRRAGYREGPVLSAGAFNVPGPKIS